MKEHMRLYNERKKAVREIICKECIVDANCGEYCEDIDYLIIMCADARYQAAPGPYHDKLKKIARDMKSMKGVTHG